MVKTKKKVFEECPKCGMRIAGFSAHHAKQNLIIHSKASQKCRKIQEILKRKGLT